MICNAVLLSHLTFLGYENIDCKRMKASELFKTPDIWMKIGNLNEQQFRLVGVHYNGSIWSLYERKIICSEDGHLIAGVCVGQRWIIFHSPLVPLKTFLSFLLLFGYFAVLTGFADGKGTTTMFTLTVGQSQAFPPCHKLRTTLHCLNKKQWNIALPIMTN